MSLLLRRGAVLVLTSALVLCTAPVSALAQTGTVVATPAARSSVIVGVSDAGHMAPVREALEAAGGSIKKTYAWNAFLVSAPEGTGSAAFSAIAERIAGVTYAQGNATVHAAGTANDPSFSLQWGLPDIGATSAWDVSQGAGVSVAVLDSGIDANQPDLDAPGQVVMNGAFNYIDPGALPFPDPDVPDPNHPYEYLGWHGTHVAGILAATRNNGVEGAGVAPLVTLYAFKVLGADGSGDDGTVASAVYDVVNKTPCRIISMSLGGVGDQGGTDQVLSDAIAYAQGHGVLVVAAAGNDATDAPEFPAAVPGVIGVGEHFRLNILAPYSNYGTLDEDLVAPGGVGGDGILSTMPGDTMQQAVGTSMATPFVSGSAALVWSAHPSWTATQVADALENTAQDLGATGTDPTYGHGLVRPDLALDPLTTISGAVPGGFYAGSVSLSLVALDTAASVSSTYYAIDGGPAQLYTAPFTVSGSGVHTVDYYSADAAGRVESPNSLRFSIATLEPGRWTAISGNTVGWSPRSETIAFAAGGSVPPLTTFYALDGGDATTYTAPFVLSAEGTTTLDYYSVDASGRAESTNTAIIQIDTVAPVTTLLGVSPGGTHASPVLLTLYATDRTSGVSTTFYSLDGSPARGYSSSVAVSSPGLHVIRYWSVDNAGVSEVPQTTTFTVSPPATETITAAASASSVKLRVSFVLSGTLTPSTLGRTVVVLVQKPGSGRWSYSSARLTYGTAAKGGALWWYRYVPIVRGTYRFQSTFAGDASGTAAASRLVSVWVR